MRTVDFRQNPLTHIPHSHIPYHLEVDVDGNTGALRFRMNMLDGAKVCIDVPVDQVVTFQNAVSPPPLWALTRQQVQDYLQVKLQREPTYDEIQSFGQQCAMLLLDQVQNVMESQFLSWETDQKENGDPVELG